MDITQYIKNTAFLLCCMVIAAADTFNNNAGVIHVYNIINYLEV